MHPLPARPPHRCGPPRGSVLLAALAATVLASALVSAPPAASAAGQEADVTAARVEGPTRFHTAANIATLTFQAATVAVLATGEDHPDALAASYAAGVADGPVLLTARDDVPAPTHEALRQLGVRTVVLIGGPGAISPAVQQRLADEGYEVHRHAGADRYSTAAAVATAFGDGGPVGTLEGDRTAILASGEAFADALAAGPLAARAHLPLLLTTPDAPHDAATAALRELAIDRIIVVGGRGAVGSDVVLHYRDRGYRVERFAGADRTGTAVTIARNALQRFGFTTEGILLARGDDYPDALAAGVHGAVLGAPLLLSAAPEALSRAAEDLLVGACPDVRFVRAVGGTSAVSTAVLREAVEAAGRCDDDPGDGIGTWSALEGANQPDGRLNHTAVWSGRELVVWGGGEQPTDTGAAYDPSTGTWRPLPQAPIAPRWAHVAVWAGDRMVVYGGSEGPDHLADCFDDGAALHLDEQHPATDRWTALPPNPYHDAGCGATAVWSGSEVLVWGGARGGTGIPHPVNAGAAYNPATDRWRPLPANPIGGRTGHVAVWTGTHMVVVGGTDAQQELRGEAAAYDPAADTWTVLPDLPIPPRHAPAAAWTGTELVLVGGSVGADPRNDGAALDPAANRWRRIADVLGRHLDPEAVYTGARVVVVGGHRDGQRPAAVAWDPQADRWTALAPLPGEHRLNHTATWVGDRLVVFGGQTAAGTAGGHAWRP